MNLDVSVSFDPDAIDRGESGLWRYRPFLPAINEVRSLGEGMTPLIAGKRPGEWLKLENLAPTGSFKDRGAAVMLASLAHAGVTQVVEDSSGNAGAAVAAYAALWEIEAEIFVPAGTSPTKTAQARASGAMVTEVPGGREATAAWAQLRAEQVVYASHVWNPGFFEGTKTIAYELWEQMNGELPDVVLLPVGNGSLLLGLARGFQELIQALPRLKYPRFVGVQARNCAPLAGYEPSHHPTAAEGIRVASPARQDQIRRAIAASGGYWLTVTEKQLRVALCRAVGRGLLIEPTSAVALAGLEQYYGREHRGQTVVTIITGSGLKVSNWDHYLLPED
ncbi:MAG: pyridoxal-phosphate dependent enzyme [Bacillota bacterium]